MKVGLFGITGKVGSVLAPALEAAGYDVRDARQLGVRGCDLALDFTVAKAVIATLERCLEARVPLVIGTTGFDLDMVAFRARESAMPVFHASNFSRGALLMMQFAEQAAKAYGRAEIIELHDETKKDAPSGTARATVERMGIRAPIHSVRLPGLVAHQEVIFGGPGETLTIRHDTTSREAFVPGVLLALSKVRDLPNGLTVGLEALM